MLNEAYMQDALRQYDMAYHRPDYPVEKWMCYDFERSIPKLFKQIDDMFVSVAHSMAGLEYNQPADDSPGMEDTFYCLERIGEITKRVRPIKIKLFVLETIRTKTWVIKPEYISKTVENSQLIPTLEELVAFHKLANAEYSHIAYPHGCTTAYTSCGCMW